MTSFAVGTKYYVSVTLTNAQASGTPANFPALATINPSSYALYLASDLSNANWQDGAGNILNSWRESGTANTDTVANYWVNLGNLAVPANGTLTIYFCFYATTAGVLNTSNTGVAPDITATYAQYDNGGIVFPVLYDGFAGTILNATKWLAVNNGISQNNKLQISLGNSDYGLVISQSKVAYPVIAEGKYNIDANVGAPQYSGPVECLTQTPNNGVNVFLGAYAEDAYANALASANTTGQMQYSNGSGGVVGIGTALNVALPAIVGMQWSATGKQYGLVNNAYNTEMVATDTNLAIADYYLEALGFGTGGGGTGTVHCQWFRARPPPPNNVMPATTFGTVDPVSSLTIPPKTQSVKYMQLVISNKVILP